MEQSKAVPLTTAQNTLNEKPSGQPETRLIPRKILGGEINEHVSTEIVRFELYGNASVLTLKREEQENLQKSVNPNEIEIRPDGFIYLPQIFYRLKLNEVIGAGQWALIQNGKPSIIENTICFDGSLYVRGCFISRSVGEGDYHPNNPMSSWASTLESAKSDCLVRCCKDLGIGKEVWMPRFIEKWIAENAIRVFRSEINKGSGGYQWRRKDAKPFLDESYYMELLDSIDKCKSIDLLDKWAEENEKKLGTLSDKQRQVIGNRYNLIKKQYRPHGAEDEKP